MRKQQEPSICTARQLKHVEFEGAIFDPSSLRTYGSGINVLLSGDPGLVSPRGKPIHSKMQSLDIGISKNAVAFLDVGLTTPCHYATTRLPSQIKSGPLSATERTKFAGAIFLCRESVAV